MTAQQVSGSAVLAGCVVILATLPLRAWILMLVIGALHSVILAVPAIGFGTMLLLTIGLDFSVATVRRLFRK